MPPPDPLDQMLGNSSGAQTRRLPSATGTQLLEFVLEKSSKGRPALLGKILIVDIDQLNRSILARNLQREGYGVQIEEDGSRALEFMEKGPSTWCCGTCNCPA